MANGNGGYEDEEAGMSVASAADVVTAPKSATAKKKNKKKKAKGKNKKPVGSPKDPDKKRKDTVPRNGMTAEEYYAAEKKAIATDYKKCLHQAHKQARTSRGETLKDQGIAECKATKKKALAGAKRRRGLPSKDPKSVADKKEETLLDGENAWKKKFHDQTDQNYIALNMLAFAELSQRPTPSQLSNPPLS